MLAVGGDDKAAEGFVGFLRTMGRTGSGNPPTPRANKKAGNGDNIAGKKQT